LCAFPGLRAKLGYCRKLLFPSAAYMHNKYDDGQSHWLPWLYLRRIAAGLVQRFQLGWQRR